MWTRFIDWLLGPEQETHLGEQIFPTAVIPMPEQTYLTEVRVECWVIERSRWPFHTQRYRAMLDFHAPILLAATDDHGEVGTYTSDGWQLQLPDNSETEPYRVIIPVLIGEILRHRQRLWGTVFPPDPADDYGEEIAPVGNADLLASLRVQLDDLQATDPVPGSLAAQRIGLLQRSIALLEEAGAIDEEMGHDDWAADPANDDGL